MSFSFKVSCFLLLVCITMLVSHTEAYYGMYGYGYSPYSMYAGYGMGGMGYGMGYGMGGYGGMYGMYGGMYSPYSMGYSMYGKRK